MRRWTLLLFLVTVGCESTVTPEGPTRLRVEAEGLPPFIEPVDNLTTVEGVALGRRLFYDPILSQNQTQSCSSCHLQEFAFSDPRQFSVGDDGSSAGDRNAPAIINPAWLPTLFWNGRAASLEIQAMEPVPNPIEMNLEWDVAEERLNAHGTYPGMFEAAFGTRTITRDLVTKAIAQFERTLISNDSRFDQWQRGEIELTPPERRGYDKFLDEAVGDCFHCHGISGLMVTTQGPNAFANNGIDLDPDPGRYNTTGDERDRGKFKSPTVRNIELTAPYMHDGRFATLEEVLEHYDSGIHEDSPNLDTKLRLRKVNNIRMTAEDKADIIAFLKSLTDDSFTTNPDLSDPFQN